MRRAAAAAVLFFAQFAAPARADDDAAIFAKLGVARGQALGHEFQAELQTYASILAAKPGFTVDFPRCMDAVGIDACGGDPSISERVRAIRAFLKQQQTLEARIASSSTRPDQKALAWYELGQAWEAKNAIDPGPNDHPPHWPDRTDSEACYDAAVKAAPRSLGAGNARWRLAAFTAPYEWEGDVFGRAKWIIEQYGAFVRDYPGHPRTGDALFEIARARWASAGYVEVFGYIMVPGGHDVWLAEQERLEQWFDTSGFGGGSMPSPLARNPEATREAQRDYKEIVAKYPRAKSAPEAEYYIAVISDYCLGDAKSALQEYAAFLKNHGGSKDRELKALAGRARKRIEALNKGSL